MKLSVAIALVLLVAQYASSLAAAAAAGGPRVIIVGAGMSGISTGKRLSDAGISDFVILEATDRIGGRIHKTNFAGVDVEMGANWVEGVTGKGMNPIWTIVNDELKLRTFNSDYDHLANNTYKQNGGLYEEAFVQKIIDRADEVEESGGKLSASLHASGSEDMSVMAMQRLNDHMPWGPSAAVDMVIDYCKYDYEFAEPPRVTSLQNTKPLPTFNNFGDEVHFVADQRGYESVVYHVAGKYLRTDKSSGAIVDPRLKLNKVVRDITYLPRGVTVKTEDGQIYRADYVMLSVSLGVLQTDLIRFKPQLPAWKIVSIYQFDMSVYTKIFLKFPKRFWPEGPGTEFFLYASGRRGYYPVWQQATLISHLLSSPLVSLTSPPTRTRAPPHPVPTLHLIFFSRSRTSLPRRTPTAAAAARIGGQRRVLSSGGGEPARGSAAAGRRRAEADDSGSTIFLVHPNGYLEHRF